VLNQQDSVPRQKTKKPRRRAVPTNRILPLLCGAGLFLASTAQAVDTTFYIKPNMNIAVRKSKSDNSKAVAIINMGTSVEVLKKEKIWSHVQLQNHMEGWVRTRYLDHEPVIPEANIHLQKDAEGNIINPVLESERLNKENQGLKKELTACTTDRSTLADKYQTVVGDPTSALNTRRELNSAKEQIEALQQQLSEAEIENTVLRKNQSIKWFFTGSMVLLVGWIIGRISRNNKKRRSSSLLS